MVYVSITGLKLKYPWSGVRFFWHASQSMGQAKSVDGNISAEARTINGVHHTLSVWRDKASMRAFLYSGAHGNAVKAFRSFATGMTFGFEAEKPPSWDEVHQLW
ncbi:MAG: DUF3291 domain-containing protein, partial [Pseudomonadota bacterium]